MQNFLCRGKKKSNGEWVTGYLFKTQEHTYIAYPEQFDDDLFLSPQNIFVEVMPETVSRFSGFEATNGKIFEGHIILSANHYFIVTYGRCGKGYEGFYLQGYDDRTKKHINQGLRNDIHYWLEEYGAEIIGSVFENPKLLEERE